MNLRPPFFLLIPAVFVMAGVILPFIYLILRAFEANLTDLKDIVLRVKNLELLFNTLILTISVLVGTSFLATPLAFWSARTNFKAKWLLILLGILPIAMPGYVGAYIYLAASGTGGTISEFTGIHLPIPTGFWGAFFILTLFTYPYLFLNLYTSFNTMDSSLEESSRSLGKNSWQTFRSIILPQLKPAWSAGFLLIGLHVLGDFAVTSLMRYPTFSTALFHQYTAAYDRVYSAWLALFLLIFTIGFLVIESQYIKRLYINYTSSQSQKRAFIYPIGKWNIAAWLLLLTLAILIFVIPIGTLLHWCLQQLSLSEDFLVALRNTTFIAAVSAIIITAFAFPIAYLGNRFSHRKRAMITERMAYLGYATPPLVLVLALVFFSLKIVPNLYQSFPLLVFGYMLHFLAEALGPLRTGLCRATTRLEEAGKMLKLTNHKILGRIIIPLLRPSFIASFIFIFLSIIKELPITLLLSPIGFDTLAYNVWTYTEEALYLDAAPYALALLFNGFILNFILLKRTLKGQK